MKSLTALLVLVCMSSSVFAAEFQCDKAAAEQAISFLGEHSEFVGDLEIGKFNQLSVLLAYQTFLESQIAATPDQKQVLLAKAIEICGDRD